ncbi:MAG: MFS transporter, partial [Verrucomicrobiota bacterium]
PAYFLLAAAPGCWIPVLANVLNEQGWHHWVTFAFLIPPLSGTIAPLLFAAVADQRIAAERVLAWSLWGGAVFLYLAFEILEAGKFPVLFLICFFIAQLSSAPAWALLNAVAFANLKEKKKNFGLFRVWGTFGWAFAGWMVSAMAWDSSPAVGKLAVAIRVLAGIVCLLLPHTPPQGAAPKSWQQARGLHSLRILRQRDIGFFFLTSFLFSIPLSAFYMQTPQFLQGLGETRVALLMTTGQMTEVLAMLGLGYVLTRWRIKWLLLLALGAGCLRYAFYGWGAEEGSLPLVLFGIAMHGICWTFFFEAGRVFLDERVDPAFRAQTQALLTLLTMGLGSIVGTASMGMLQDRWVANGTSEEWAFFWRILTGLCLLATLLFAFGYRGRKNANSLA